MATLKVPHPPPSPVEDAEQLRKAFEGSPLSLSLAWHTLACMDLTTQHPHARECSLAFILMKCGGSFENNHT